MRDLLVRPTNVAWRSGRKRTVREKWFSKRALLWHLLLVVIVPGCLLAGWWQVHRAMQGNTLSYAYSAEWPVFAVVAMIGWWQLIQEDPSEVEARRSERVRRAQPRQALTATPELLAANRAALERHRAHLPAPATSNGDLALIEDRAGGLQPVASAGMSAYNAYLATLATHGKAKTWRNPKGMPERPEED